MEIIPKHKLIPLCEHSIFMFLETDSMCLLTLSSNCEMSVFPNEKCSRKPSNDIYCLQLQDAILLFALYPCHIFLKTCIS